MTDLYQQIATILTQAAEGISREEILETLEAPQNAKMGDCAFPCFKLSKLMKKAPQQIAVDLQAALSDKLGNGIEKAEASGAYLNFFFDKGYAASGVLSEAIKNGDNYGKLNIGEGKCVVIDYSSPNIAKPFHIGHLYSTFIGAALYNIYDFLGYKPFGINYLGDWGTQFGKMIVAYKKWSSEAQVEKDGLKELTRVYVQFHEKAENDPALDGEARAWLVKMQSGDEEALRLWKWFRELSLKDYERAYKRLGISFDSYNGESFYNDKMSAVVDELREKNLLEEDKGAMIVRLDEYKMPPCLILKSDGGTLYPTRDIASALYRYRNYHFHKAIYVTDARQSLHFAQWFKVVGLMGYDFEKDLVHVPYGFLKLEEGLMSTRKGNQIGANDLIDEGVRRVKAVIDEKNPNLENKDEVAEQVTLGAIKFADMYNSRIKDVVFDWDKILSFDGETGPYVQYTHARASSILEKAGEIDLSSIDLSVLSDDDSFAVIKLLADFSARVKDAAQKNEPYIISRYVMELAQSFNKFYHDNPILTSEGETKKARLVLVTSVKTVIKSALRLLGITAPERM